MYRTKIKHTFSVDDTCRISESDSVESSDEVVENTSWTVEV